MLRKLSSKKVLTLVVSTVCPVTVFASSASPMSTINKDPGFEFNIAAVWLQPGASNLNYVILNKELPAQSPTWQEQELQPPHSTGVELSLRYVFPNSSHQDTQLKWTHLDSNTSDQTNVNTSQYFLGPDYEIGPTGIPIHHSDGEAEFNYDVINWDLGQTFFVGGNTQLRLFGGLSAGLLREKVTANYAGNTTGVFAGPFNSQQVVKSSFSGVGPHFGANVHYLHKSGFGFMGEAAMATLIGSQYARTEYTSKGAELLAVYNETVNKQRIWDETVMEVIPGFSTKVGVDYTYRYRKALLGIAVGYEAAVYVNAISQYIPGSLVEDVAPLETGGIFVATMNHTLSNYSVQGPFLELSIKV